MRTSDLEIQIMFDDLFDDKAFDTEDKVYNFAERLKDMIDVSAQDYIDDKGLGEE